MINETKNRKRTEKPLGIYLVEAGIVTLKQIEIALEEQKRSKHQRLGEVLASHGWVAQETIEYLIDKVVLPERQAIGQYENEELSVAQISGYNSWQPAKSPRSEVKIELTIVKITRLLLFIVIGLISFHLLLQFSFYFLPDYPLRDTLIPLFDVDEENNIPAFYSVSALVFCCILLAVISYQKKVVGDRYTNHWRALTIIFAYLAVDEAVSIHEMAIAPVRERLNTSGFLHYAWVIPASALLVVFLVVFLKFIADLPAKIKRLFLVAGGVFVGGAIGMELIGGYLADTYGQENYPYIICASTEELLEMLGIVIFINALFSYIVKYLKVSSIKFNITDNRQRMSA